MGQGSHTAMPVYAYFMEKVLKDPGLRKKYEGKISDKPDRDILRTWKCSTYIPPDTTEVDSVGNDTTVNPYIVPEHEMDLELEEEEKAAEDL